ncbi:hypothetical protein L6164_001365 [Bauhinia variegata]|uniref:Uncharacterized protein n=1 Tax=Bauhinia variegata TaxID=167791 RepID=A0ACB9Q9J6_BAUVA|nr:hypothetical protein L6164_001365 [Bauhinia variegata]
MSCIDQNRRVHRATLKEETRTSEATAMMTNCTHCNQTGHPKDCCYELVGYPEWWDHSRASKKRNPKNISNIAKANTDNAPKRITNIRPSLQKSIFIANGNEALIIGEGSIPFTNILNLNSILLVPSINYNLLSISQLTKTLSCVVIF